MMDYYETKDKAGNKISIITCTEENKTTQKHIHLNHGLTEYFENHRRHREYAPAIESENSKEEEGYFVHGVDITAEVRKLMKSGMLQPDWREWNQKDHSIFKLKFL